MSLCCSPSSWRRIKIFPRFHYTTFLSTPCSEVESFVLLFSLYTFSEFRGNARASGVYALFFNPARRRAGESNESLKFIIRRSEVNPAGREEQIKVVSYGKTQARAEKMWNFPAEQFFRLPSSSSFGSACSSIKFMNFNEQNSHRWLDALFFLLLDLAKRPDEKLKNFLRFNVMSEAWVMSNVKLKSSDRNQPFPTSTDFRSCYQFAPLAVASRGDSDFPLASCQNPFSVPRQTISSASTPPPHRTRNRKTFASVVVPRVAENSAKFLKFSGRKAFWFI